MITLRPEQDDVLREASDLIRNGTRRILIQAACGFGKTLTAATILKRASDRGRRCFFAVHRKELIDQSIEAFNMVGIKHGVISAGWHPMRAAKVQIASIPSWKNRIKRVATPDIIVVDECHRAVAPTYTNIINQYPDAILIGLTATPERLDGRGLNQHFDEMVTGPSTRWLIENGRLAPYRLLTCPSIMTDGLHTRMGDFAIGELIERANASTITSDALREYTKHAAGKRFIIFECSRERSRRAAERFTEAGFPCAHVDGETPRDERDKAMRDFRAGRIIGLSNVELFGEGVDVPEMECSIHCRPTQSLAMWIQQSMRPMRYAPGKTATILDHAGNYARHGAPDAERTWTLEGRVSDGAGEKSPPMGRQCVWCSAVSPPQRTKCVECGKAFPVKERKVVEIDGELVEVDMTPEEQRRHDEIRESMTMFVEKDFDALVQEGRRRGVNNPHSYAMWVIEGRRRKRA